MAMIICPGMGNNNPIADMLEKPGLRLSFLENVPILRMPKS